MENILIDTITPRWLKLTAAAKYSSIGEKRLVALASGPDKKISGFPDPDDPRHPWIFDRLSIDSYRLTQAGAGNLDREKIKEYLKRKG